MNVRDYIGSRGEALFAAMITDWCGEDEPWFEQTFLGGKYATKDFLVNLVNPTSLDAQFFVQVKATRGIYTSKAPTRKLKVGIDEEDMKLLKNVPAPVFVVGIDIETKMGYVVQITQKTGKTLPSIPLTHPLNCTQIKAIWEYVDNYWAKKAMLPPDSALK